MVSKLLNLFLNICIIRLWQNSNGAGTGFRVHDEHHIDKRVWILK